MMDIQYVWASSAFLGLFWEWKVWDLSVSIINQTIVLSKQIKHGN